MPRLREAQRQERSVGAAQQVGHPRAPVEMGAMGRTWDDVITKLNGVKPLALATDVPADMADFLADRRDDFEVGTITDCAARPGWQTMLVVSPAVGSDGHALLGVPEPINLTTRLSSGRLRSFNPPEEWKLPTSTVLSLKKTEPSCSMAPPKLPKKSPAS